MTSLDPNRATPPRPANDAAEFRSLVGYWPAAAALALATIVRSVSWLNCDVSWNLTLGEKVLAGARPYIDFSDPNPPASFLIYVPAILIGREFGVSAEFVVTALVFAATFLSLWLVERTLTENEPLTRRDRPIGFALACVLLLVLPGDAFAQRDHIALLAILPMLAVYSQRAVGRSPRSILTGLAGIGGGIAIAIKPYFALALLVPLPYVVWRWRNHKQKIATFLTSPEQAMTLLVVLAYGALLVRCFPDYLNHGLPVALAVYSPLNQTFLLMLANPSVILVAMAVIVGLGLQNGRIPSPLIIVCSLAAFGFAFALIAQGKGWPYHGYPAVALAMMALGLLLVRRFVGFSGNTGSTKPPVGDLVFGIGLFACIYAVASVNLLNEPGRGALVREVARLAPTRPKIVTLAGGPEVAFPLTRKLHGTPVGRAPFQWISYSADKLLGATQLGPAARQKLEQYELIDRKELADNIRGRHPDAVLVEGDGEKSWAFSHPEIAAALGAYREVETVDGVEIWLPRKSAR